MEHRMEDSYQIAMIRENHPSRASSKEYGLAAMDEHLVLSRMFGNQSKSVSGRWPPLHYRLCPSCARAVPISSPEHYCINDGTWLLDACPLCSAPISSPYARYCASCGESLLGPDQDSQEDTMNST